MNQGKATGPKPQWWSRLRGGTAPDPAPAPEPAPITEPAPATPPAAGGPGTPADPVPPSGSPAPGAPAEGLPVAPPVPPPAPVPSGPDAERPAGEPRHPSDPYGTPPYGSPGPWAPAPPVQRPAVTPARGTALPAEAAVPPPSAGTGAEDAAAGRLPAAVPPPAADATVPPPAAEPAVPPQGPPVPAPGASAAEGSAPAAGTAPPASPAAPAPAVDAASEGAAPSSPAAGGASPGPAPAPAPAGPAPVPAGPAAGPPAAPVPPAAPSAGGTDGHWERYDPWRAPGSPVTSTAFLSPDGPEPAARLRRSPSRGALLAGALLLTLVAGGIGGGVGAYIERNGGVVDVALPQAPAEDRPRDPRSIAGIAEAALPGVVTFHVKGGGKEGTGTGFVLDRRGHILTNNHVVEAAASGGDISVTFSGGTTAEAEIVGRDSGYDLAVVRVSGVRGLQPLRLGNSDSVRVGDPVVAIGAPYDLAGTVTSGIISAKERPITAGSGDDGGSDVSYVDAIQTDAPINPGNSGGPLMDGEGRVIGINSAIRAADDETGLGASQGGSIGLGFAIPVNQGKRVAEELINTGRATHPVIGVTLDMRFTGDGARVGVDDGDRPAVTPDGPGDKAGIRAGDVITAVNGARVHNGEELIVKIRAHRPGDRLELTLERDGRERTLRLTLGSASDDK
ncbi:S1C family serine protease [Streptomyces xinghaiensis]|uniref:PDZ domain-containing protein n=2 Tax=Streptomyces TaxID=1883 RepID=A0A3R7I9X0_9ACTN|nr:trypsin-like peptidase domain-containing protein [Streptomyces xinghaiensis]PQM24147.1 protease [Streptomyces xinghaiensis]RKM97112.1 PDZ domain-containing protein [Streptomyces xinghaiensis]RNC75495.1 PDZ domain-containing protein [Streptomyces xinghaiensis]